MFVTVRSVHYLWWMLAHNKILFMLAQLQTLYFVRNNCVSSFEKQLLNCNVSLCTRVLISFQSRIFFLQLLSVIWILKAVKLPRAFDRHWKNKDLPKPDQWQKLQQPNGSRPLGMYRRLPSLPSVSTVPWNRQSEDDDALGLACRRACCSYKMLQKKNAFMKPIPIILFLY